MKEAYHRASNDSLALFYSVCLQPLLGSLVTLDTSCRAYGGLVGASTSANTFQAKQNDILLSNFASTAEAIAIIVHSQHEETSSVCFFGSVNAYNKKNGV